MASLQDMTDDDAQATGRGRGVRSSTEIEHGKSVGQSAQQPIQAMS